MKKIMNVFYLISVLMLFSCVSKNYEIEKWFVKLTKGDIDMYGCLKEDTDKDRMKLVDEQLLTDRYLEFSEPCNGTNCVLAIVENNHDKYLFLKGPEQNIKSKNAGLKIFLIDGDNLEIFEKDLILFDKEKIDNYIKEHPKFNKIYKMFNGSIPYEIKLPKKGNDLNLFINDEFLNEEININSFGKFVFKEERYNFSFENINK